MSEADITRMFKLAPKLQKRRTLHKVEQFIHLFEKRGFTQVQIANIMRLWPHLIGFAGTTMESKIKLPEDFGFVDQTLAKLLSYNASILSHNLENDLLPKMEFLKNIFQSQEVLVKALLKGPRLLSLSLEKTLRPSLAFWEGWFFSGMELVSFIRVCPSALSRTSLTAAQLDLINKIGADKDSKMFKYIIGTVVRSHMETLEAKIENLKLCGLSAEEIWQLLGASPQVIELSKENICERINFIVNNMELPANYVVKHSHILKLNLEKTMRPRFLVWQKIKSSSEFNLPLLTVLSMTKTKFVSKIIEGHPESKTLWTIYEKAISNASNRTKSSTKNIILDGESERRDSKITTN